jgi:hypothetical protein
MEPENFTNCPEKFSCNICNTICSRKREWDRHILTAKHKKLAIGNKSATNFTTKKEYICHCEKKYKTHSGLWKHKKLCINPKFEPSSQQINLLTNIVLEIVKNNSELLQQNQVIQKQSNELQKQMLEVCKVGNSTINNHSNNKTFNMQFFLNEQCKDAMNIMEFVDTFKFDFSDLERVGEIGYVECMSNVIIQKLNEMDIYKRPIHCSDAKRETMFVKDKNVWEKENETHDKLRLAIRYIAKKNSDMLNKWCDAHPGSCDSDNYLNDIYLEMVMQAMGGRGGREENENKIMRKIARSVLIDKS